MSELIRLKRKKTKYAWLLEFDEVKRWLKELPSATTRYEYLCHLDRYCKYKSKNPKELIEEALKRQRSDDPNVRNLTNQDLLSFYEYLREYGESKVKGLKHASKTSLLYYSAMRSFYRYNGIELPKFSRRLRVTSSMVEHERGYIPSPEDVNLSINYAEGARNKAIIATLASSGQRDGVLTALKYKNVKDDLERVRTVILRVPSFLPNVHGINVNKNRTAYFFGISKEALEYIKAMIDERRRYGEVIDNESWLFRSYAKTHRLQGSTKEGTIPVRVTKDTKGEPISTCGIINIVEGTAIKAGLMEPRTVSGERAKIHPHSFRKYFKKQASKGVKEARELLLVEYFMGHKVPALQSAYPAVDFNDPEVVRAFYEQIEPNLSWVPKPISEVERRKQTILDLARTVMPEDRYRMLEGILSGCLTMSQIDEAIERFRKGETQKKEKEIGVIELDSENSDCQKMISEAQLEAYLSKGYRFVATLPSGKCVIEKNNH